MNHKDFGGQISILRASEICELLTDLDLLIKL